MLTNIQSWSLPWRKSSTKLGVWKHWTLRNWPNTCGVSSKLLYPTTWRSQKSYWIQFTVMPRKQLRWVILSQSRYQTKALQTDVPYPTDELEWIATKSFNHAVDLYCSGDDNGCRSWAGRALNVAHFCSDGGALEKLLQDKLLNLRFDEWKNET